MKIDSSHNFLNTSPSNINPVCESSTSKQFDNILQKVANAKDNKKLYEACQGLESVFLNQVFSSMRATIPRSDLIKRGFATETYESMLFTEYSKQVSESCSTGIADILYRQLSSKNK